MTVRLFVGNLAHNTPETVNEATPREDRGSGGAHCGGEQSGGYGISDGGHRW